MKCSGTGTDKTLYRNRQLCRSTGTTGSETTLSFEGTITSASWHAPGRLRHDGTDQVKEMVVGDRDSVRATGRGHTSGGGGQGLAQSACARSACHAGIERAGPVQRWSPIQQGLG